MVTILRLLIGVLRDCIMSRGRLEAEVVVLRHQLNILRRQSPRRVRPNAFDRAIFVFKAKCEGPAKPLSEGEDKKIEQLLRQKWIRPMLVDERIALAARRLMRLHPECKKPADALHLATALALNVDEMHTFDGSDLLKLDKKVNRADGKPLRICIPAPLPIPEPPLGLFTDAEDLAARR